MAALIPVPSPPEESDRPFPPRFWWLKRGIVLAALALAALSALRWWWGREADRRMRAEIAAAHARGEPILPADFDNAPIPDGENAALSLRRAAGMLDESQSFDDFESAHPPGQQLTNADRQEIRRILAQLQPALRVARAARAQTGIDWGFTVRFSPLTGGMYSDIMGSYNRQRHLANALHFAATGSQSIGDDGASVELVRDELRQSTILEQAPSTLVNHLVAIGISQMATRTAIDLAAKWSIEEAGAASSSHATKSQLKQLIAELLDEAPLRSSSVRCWYGEGMSCLESASRNIEVRFGWLAAAPLRPMFDLDALRCAGALREVAAAARQPNLPAALAKLPLTAGSNELSHLDCATRESQWAVGGIRNIGARVLTVSYEAIAERRIAAVIVGVRLYRSDHGDNLPGSLADLVPGYLPYVLIDPMAGDGRPLSYHPNARVPVVYSVGTNGIDDGGTTLASPTSTSTPWNLPDAVFPIDPAPLATTQPSSSETENHRPN